MQKRSLALDPLPGAVCAQYVRCGRANCRCATGMLHGPYYYRFVRIDGRLCKRYIRRADLPEVCARTAAHRRERRQLACWRQLVRHGYGDMRAQWEALTNAA
jgi:hypothetical protein